MGGWALVYFADEDAYGSVPCADIINTVYREKDVINVKWKHFDAVENETIEKVYEATVLKFGTKKVVNKAELEFSAKLKEARQNEKLKGPRERKATARKLAYDESEAAKSPVKAASKHSPNRKRCDKGEKSNEDRVSKKNSPAKRKSPNTPDSPQKKPKEQSCRI
ncbi:uncharacterized protein [Ptychodera flava]|uniref:uncharacterized protein n=1 Tax=Ptychodera flava TaxID=63121 RepID=UPI00396A6630